MTFDPVVEEVRRHRAEYAAKFNYDLKAIFKDLQRRTELARKAGRVVVSLSPRRPPGYRAQNKKTA